MPSNRSVVLTMLQSVARLIRTVSAKRLLEQGLYAGQDKVILALAQEDGQTPGALAQKLRVKPPTVTKTINRLMAQGFLEKRSSDEDARRTHIFLTPLGEQAIHEIELSLRKVEAQALEGIDKEDLKTLRRLLEQISQNLSNSRSSSPKKVPDSSSPELERSRSA